MKDGFALLILTCNLIGTLSIEKTVRTLFELYPIIFTPVWPRGRMSKMQSFILFCVCVCVDV